jgi:hypothetical protein
MSALAARALQTPLAGARAVLGPQQLRARMTDPDFPKTVIPADALPPATYLACEHLRIVGGRIKMRPVLASRALKR